MPSTMSRVVKLRTENGEWIQDPTWHQSVRETLLGLLRFFESRQLLRSPDEVLSIDFDKLTLRHSDLTEAGIALVKSRAVDRWLASFDRSPAKSKSNYTILDKALQKIAGSA